MVKITGTVTAVSQKPDKYGFAIGSGNWYNGNGICPCKKGDTVDVEYVVNGAFKNVESVKVSGSNFAPATGPSDANKYNMQMSKLKNKTNARVCALECATQLVPGSSENRKEEVLALAAELVLFIENEA